VRKSKRYSLVFAAVVLFVPGCSNGSGDTTASSQVSAPSADDVVFGSGEIPGTLPGNFPIPQGSVVGSTMVVSKTGFTEVILRINADIELSVDFFDQGLSQAGFAIDSSASDEYDGWLIEYSDVSAKGAVRFVESAEGITQAVVRHNLP
jgi:hypothetical protein